MTRPPAPRDAYWAFLLEHTGLTRSVIQRVLDANDAFWERKVEQLGLERAAQWAQGEGWNDAVGEKDG